MERNPHDALDAARSYLARGWAPVPVLHREKGPRLAGWQRLRLTEADLTRYFNGHSQNIGILLGAASNGLVDVDLDCPEAMALADRFLPPTAAAFGRQSKPRAHRLYRASGLGPAPHTRRFQDPLAVPDAATLVELRGDGAQTIFPPSAHPSGEVVRWDQDDAPAEVDAATLERAVRHLAAAALLTRHWPGRGARHDAALAVAGALLRAGWAADEVEHFIEAVALAAGDEETRDRVRTVASTAARLAEGGAATGLPRLRELIDARVVDALVSWLGLREGRASEAGARHRAAADAADSPPVPAFPLAAVPEPARAFLAAAAAALDCPADFVAVPFLAEAAAAIGNQLALAVTQSWLQTAQLWVCTVGEPGTAKTPAAEQAGKPLDALQQEALETWREAVKQHERDLAAWQAERKERTPGEKPERPEPEHFWTSDATIEGLMRIIAHPRNQTPGLVVRRDELVGWVRSFDAYKAGRGGERQTWLTLWSGRPVKVDRAGRDPYFCARPCVSVCGSVQPDMLPQLEEEAGCRDGFLERILWSWPDARPMRLSDFAIGDELLARVITVFRRLRAVQAAADGGPRVVVLSAEARALFMTWHDENCTAQERVAGLLRGYYAKLPSQAARLCLVLHALAHPDDPTVPVSGATMQAALELVEYFRAHAHRVFARFGVRAQVQDSAALRLYRTLARLGGRATGRELAAAGCRPGPERDRALQALIAAGLVQQHVVAHDGPGRPALQFTLTAPPTSEFVEFVAGGMQPGAGAGEGEGEAGRRALMSMNETSAADRGARGAMCTAPSNQSPTQQIQQIQQIAGAGCSVAGCTRPLDPLDPLDRFTPAGAPVCLVHVVLDVAERRGWPRYIAGGVRVVHGAEGWRAFCQTAPPEALAEAAATLAAGQA